MAMAFIIILCDEEVDFYPRGVEAQEYSAKVLAKALIAQEQTALGYDGEKERFNIALDLIPGKFDKFPSPRKIINLLPVRKQAEPQSFTLSKEERERSAKAKEIATKDLFKDVKSCSEIEIEHKNRGLKGEKK